MSEGDGYGRFVIEQRDLNPVTFFGWTIEFNVPVLLLRIFDSDFLELRYLISQTLRSQKRLVNGEIRTSV